MNGFDYLTINLLITYTAANTLTTSDYTPSIFSMKRDK